MKITINSKLLKGALEQLSAAYNPRAVVPVILNAKVEVSDGCIGLTMTDLQTTIKRKIECSTSGKGVFLIPFKEIKNISGILDAPLTIEYIDKGGIVVKFENDTYKLGKSDNPEDFPNFPQVKRESEISVGKDFFSAVKIASKSVSKDATMQYDVSHVCVEFGRDGIIITGTDKNTLFTQTIPSQLPVKDNIELLLPFAAIPALNGFLEAKVYHNKDNILFVGSDVEVCLLLGGVKYPPWRTIIPNHKTNLSLDVNDLIFAINKSLAINGHEVFAITLQPEKDNLHIKTESRSMGMECNSVIPCKSSVSFDEISLNRNQLLGTLKQLSDVGGQDLEISMQSPQHAASIKMSGIETVTTLVMPIQK